MAITYEGIQDLREQRKKLTVDAGEILKKAHDEKREMSDEENKNFEAAHAEGDKLKARIDREERQLDRETEQGELVERKAEIQTAEDRVTERSVKEQQRDVLRRWSLGEELTAEERMAVGSGKFREGGVSGNAVKLRLAGSNCLPEPIWRGNNWVFDKDEYRKNVGADIEQRAQTVTTTGGGHVIADAPMAGIDEALLAFGGMRQAGATVIRTATGGDLPIPTVNDTASAGELLAINTDATAGDFTFGQVVLGAYKYSSLLVLVPWELMQDSSFDFASFTARNLGTRLGRILNTHFTAGTGSSQPNGVKNVANGAVTTVASATAVTANEIIDLQETLDPAYDQNAKFMFNQSTRGALRKLLDGDSNYIWRPGLAFGEPDTILGKPYVVNQDMRSIGADKRSILYGDFSKYYIRDVMDILVVRMDERYATAAQTGFVAFSRHDGDIIDAGTNPILAIRHPAS